MRTVPLCKVLWSLALGSFAPGTLHAGDHPGARIYQEHCVNCHGARGEGVAGKYDEPLYGERSVHSLARLIDRTMPEGEPEAVKGRDADQVAEYIFQEFYSPQARARLFPATIDFARMTVRQYQHAVADLLSSFNGRANLSDERGLRGTYHNSRNFNRDKKAFDRIDGRFQLAFGTQAPAPGMNPDEFSIRWRGSITPDETGDYEFALKTENGARLYLNNDRTPLIDAWVSSGHEVREHKETIHLLGGRAYPIQIDFFKFKEKSASLEVLWHAPHKGWESLPARHLSPNAVPETFVVTSSFPADDGSSGYERGTTVSRQWDAATTTAALEVAEHVLDHLERLTGARAQAEDRLEKARAFATRFAERAFRRPLSEGEQRLFVEAQFQSTSEVEKAIKKVVLLVLKSPRFLYPEIPDGSPDDYDRASRLSFALWDSLPDQPLLEAAARAELRTAAQVDTQIRRMLRDSRAKAKLADFFRHWLEMEEAEEMTKDPTAYPEFTKTILGDLRTSLDLFVEEVVWKNDASDYRQLLQADYLFMNRRMAEFYGAETNQFTAEIEVTLPPKDDMEAAYRAQGMISGEPLSERRLVYDDHKFVPVKMDPTERAGVLTHPYLLSTFAYYKSSSPIHRGVFLTRNIVGRALRPPPAAIQFMDGNFEPGLTMRQKVTELTSSAACMSCHSVINPLGFSLENFDGVGRFRTMDNGKTVDTVSEFPTSDGDTIRIERARDVADYAARSPQAHAAFVRQLFQQLVKQPINAYGAETLDRLTEFFAGANFNVQKLAAEIVKLAALHDDSSSSVKLTSNP
jgi:hypothetical protein